MALRHSTRDQKHGTKSNCPQWRQPDSPPRLSHVAAPATSPRRSVMRALHADLRALDDVVTPGTALFAEMAATKLARVAQGSVETAPHHSLASPLFSLQSPLVSPPVQPKECAVDKDAAGGSRASYGVIALRANPVTSQPEVILVHRRHSIGFQEVTCGRYELRDLPLIWLLVRDATPTERDVWLSWPFHEQRRLLYASWGPGSDKRVPDKASYREARDKFDLLRRGFWWSLDEYPCLDNDGLAPNREAQDAGTKVARRYPSGRRVKSEHSAVFVTLANLVTAANGLVQGKQQSAIPALGFPKGRKTRSEDADPDGDYACALREFAEETNARVRSSEVLARDSCSPDECQTDPRGRLQVVESVSGINGTGYRYVYYVAAVSPRFSAPHLSAHNARQSEIGYVGWVPCSAAIAHMRRHRQHARSKVLKQALGLWEAGRQRPAPQN